MSNGFDRAAPSVETPEQEAPVMYIFGLPCIQIDSLFIPAFIFMRLDPLNIGCPTHLTIMVMVTVWPPFFGHLQPNWGHFLLISHDRFMILDRSTIAEAAVDPPGVVVVHVLNHGYVSLGKCLELITA